jgi:large subunit ribosomal protein L37Ae
MVHSTRRFGAKYGRKLRAIVDSVENILRQKQMCPYCRNKKAKRLAVGIWECRKCGSKFTGSAYKI